VSFVPPQKKKTFLNQRQQPEQYSKKEPYKEMRREKIVVLTLNMMYLTRMGLPGTKNGKKKQTTRRRWRVVTEKHL